ncbi:cell division protein FtsQ/DivIB [Amphritea sp. HPY]|uniref:cell division protein FtsQ/DivIB n=1 Tax=Amphritea sp. HPY TaxID=3421652 RepID=UPI003D7E5916
MLADLFSKQSSEDAKDGAKGATRSSAVGRKKERSAVVKSKEPSAGVKSKESSTGYRSKESSAVLPNRESAAETVSDAQAGKPSAWATDGDWWLKPATILSALAVFIALGSSLLGKAYVWLDQPVAAVTVSGETSYLDKTELANNTISVLTGGLLSTDLEAVKSEIQAHPWVYQIKVNRQWPASLQLVVREEVPVARWGNSGLLNHEGDIFWPEQSEKYMQLPRLQGPSSNTGQMMSQYYDLNQMLRNIGLQVVGLNLEARGAWTLQLNNGVRLVVGREQIVERLDRFIKLYQNRLRNDAEAGRIEQIDIRYNNGLAVKWRKQPALEAESVQKG